MRMHAVAAFVVVAAVSSLGCKSLLKKRQDAGVDAGPMKLTGQDLADEQLQEKLDEYIKCLNTLSSTIHQSRHRYLAFIPKTGPTGRETTAELNKLPAAATGTCAAGVARAKTMPPPDPKLESAGAEFSTAATAIDVLINDAHDYYATRAFASDKWTKGKQLHPQLMAAWNRFSLADANLHTTLDGITKPLAQRTLARIEREDGKKFRYGRKKVIVTARELVDAANPVGDDEDIDFSLVGAAYGDFEKSIDELTAYGAANRKDLANAQNPAFPMAEMNFDTFVKESNDFKKATKDFWACLRDAPAKAKTPSGKIDMTKMGNCSSGTAAWKVGDEVIKKYNEFIRASNSHQFP